jgi:hypothetical protein
MTSAAMSCAGSSKAGSAMLAHKGDSKERFHQDVTYQELGVKNAPLAMSSAISDAKLGLGAPCSALKVLRLLGGHDGLANGPERQRRQLEVRPGEGNADNRHGEADSRNHVPEP